MARRCTSRVRFSEHACRRMKERGKTRKKITPEVVRRKLLAMLPAGLQVYGLAVEIPITERLYAVCVPETWGGWTVVTFKKTAGAKRH